MDVLVTSGREVATHLDARGVPSQGYAPCLLISQVEAADTPASIIACEEPRQAERDRQASRPNETVWILRCGSTTYRVTLIPDMAARLELVN
jgi:hypothetical protein